MTVSFRTENAAVRGNSGSLIYQITSQGTVIPLGIFTGLNTAPQRAHATPIHELLVGLERAVSKQLIKNKNLTELCRIENGINDWFNANKSEASSREFPTGFFVTPSLERSPFIYMTKHR